jgi:predicted MPP superfamily phosphohydrolase
MLTFTLIRWLYCIVNAYLIVRLFRALRGMGPMRLLPCLAALMLFAAYPAARVVEGNGLGARALAFAGTFWLPFILYVFLLLLIVDVFRLCFYLYRRFGRRAGRGPEQVFARRRLACGAIAGAALGISGLGWLNTQMPVVRAALIPAPRLARPLRIAALSDTHLGRLVTPADFSRLIELIGPLDPDLVLFAGDILDDYYGFDPEATRKSLQRLRPALGVWGILGNHEYIAGEAGTSREKLEQSGIRILRDEWADLDGKALLIGRDDRSKPRFLRRDRKALPEILAGIPEDRRGLPMILLDHQPFQLEDAEKAGVFLQISGHTHNGQLFPFNFVIPGIYENPYGYSRRGRTHYWVTSGAGTWGPRVRTSGRPEILLIDLTPEPESPEMGLQVPRGVHTEEA